MVTVKEIMENARKFGRDGKYQAVEFDQILQHQMIYHNHLDSV